MCGICGVLNFDKEHHVTADIVERMSAVLAHRGPDDGGVFVHGNIGLGHRRLSIIDLSSAGRQPLFNEDGTIVIVFNGEIYNFKELRQKLIANGHSFRSESDTEVVIHLYEEYAEACLQKLVGMFAFAIWDSRHKKLFLARDRLGIKPLLFSIAKDRILFASEIKALLECQDMTPELDYRAIHDYLTFLSIPAPNTIFADIQKLLPGHYLTCTSGKMVIRQYWDLTAVEGLEKDEDYFGEQLVELFMRVVKRHLISDVPLGVFLSGGTDSSFIVGIMSEVSTDPTKTFTIGFDEKSFDETRYSRIVANKFKTDHHEYILRPNKVDLLEELVTFFDEPFADPSALPTYLVSKMAREHVKVALSGAGGDELFAGYKIYMQDRVAEIYRKVPTCVRENVIRPVIQNLVSSKKNSFTNKAKRFLKNASLPYEKGHLGRFYSSGFDEEEKRRLYTADFYQSAIADYNSIEAIQGAYQHSQKDSLNNILAGDVITYLSDDLLTKADRMGMANSLEIRVPYLDHEFVEFVYAMPSWLKLKGLRTKYILKKIASRYIPKEAIYRKKRGFLIPIDSWFKNDLKELALDLLAPAEIAKRGLFNPGYVTSLLRDHFDDKCDNSHRLWQLIILELWYQHLQKRELSKRADRNLACVRKY